MIKTSLTPIPPNASVEEIVEISSLGWEVELAPRYFSYWGGFRAVPNKYSLIRTDSCEELCTVGSNWLPNQNRDIVNIFWEITQKMNISITHAGALLGGKLVCLIADLGQSHDIGGKGDIVQGHLHLIGSHQVGFGYQARILSNRLVCMNQLTRKVGERRKNIIRHSTKALGKVQVAVPDVIGAWTAMVSDHELLADTPIDESQAMMLLINAFGSPGKGFDDQPPVVKTAMRLFQGEMQGGHLLSAYKTAYGLLQSITEYYGHIHSYKNDAFAYQTCGGLSNQITKFERQLVKVCSHG